MSALVTALFALVSFGFGPSRGAHVSTVPTVEAVASPAHAHVADPTPDLPEARPEVARTQPSGQLPLALPSRAPAIERRVTFVPTQIALPARPIPPPHLATLGARAPPLA